MKILIGLALVTCCFLAPIDAGEYTNHIDLRHRAYASVLLGLTCLLIYREWWAFGIAGIEAGLLIVSLAVSYYWDKGGSVFDPYYARINSYAFICELLLFFGAMRRVNDRNYRTLFDHLTDRYRSGAK